MFFTFRLYKGRREVRPTNNVNGHNVLLLQLLPVPSTTEADVFRADSMPPVGNRQNPKKTEAEQCVHCRWNMHADFALEYTPGYPEATVLYGGVHVVA